MQAYNRWIRDAIASNMPYDRFVREMLTASAMQHYEMELSDERGFGTEGGGVGEN